MYSYVMDSNFRTNFQPVQQGDMLFRYAIHAQGKLERGEGQGFRMGGRQPSGPRVHKRPEEREASEVGELL